MRRIARLARCFWHGPSRAEHVLGRVAALPEATASELLDGSPALVLAPHPDDESLGCGGLIAAATKVGIPIHVVVVTDGAGGRHAPRDAPALIRRRRCETVAAAAILGVPAARLHFWSIPDGSASRRSADRCRFGNLAGDLARQAGARTILATWEFDTHPDHVATFDYARHAARQTGAALLAYPVWALMLPDRTLMPALYPVGSSIRLGCLLEQKRRAVLQHESQIAALSRLGSPAFGLNDHHLGRMLTGTESYIACNPVARRRANILNAAGCRH